MKTELTSTRGGFYLRRPKGIPQSWLTHPRSFILIPITGPKNGNPLIISVDFEATTFIVFVKFAGHLQLSVHAKMSWG